ncbi:hypothetical protein CC86DRAFT_457545 [Ophiobolus disseminans]|uniref:Uncharacterized protein n=1 Tax=Ophiobolus disseminans TaxID=1469910 RepID=A0A6A6ZSB5_9PLEO|nr:hypothetical protein CC86DRAFT_457545 [Ophiobolus disseminans]
MSALIGHAQHAAGNVSNQLQRTASSVGNQLQTTSDRLVPPKQREQILKDLHVFANRNPKLATFLAIQATLTAIPLILFILFATSTLLVSLSTCLLLAVTTAFIYTFFAVGIALFFLVPTLFIASVAATCAFLWGLVIYVILRRFNEGEEPAKKGTRVGDKLHGLTGGRLEWMSEGQTEHPKKLDQTQDASHTNGDKGYQGGGNSARHGGDGHTNGNGEWEAKWSQGTQQKQKEFAKNLGIEVESVVHGE